MHCETEMLAWRGVHGCFVSAGEAGDETRFKHIKVSKEMLFIRTKRNLQIFGVVPFVKLQNDT